MNRVFSNFKYYIVSIFLLIILWVSQLLATDNLNLSPISFDYSIASGATVSIITADNASWTVLYSLDCTIAKADDTKFSIWWVWNDELIIWTEKQFNMTINDLNNAPSNLSLSWSSIPENSSISTVIWTLAWTDDWENNWSLTYSLTCATWWVDDTSFTISGSTLSSNWTYNFETKNTYNICARVSDGTLSYDKDFVINVTDLNETPTDIAITNDNIDENVWTWTTV